MIILEQKTTDWVKDVNKRIRSQQCPCEVDFDHDYDLACDRDPATEEELEIYGNAYDIIESRSTQIDCDDCMMYCDECEYDEGDRVERLRQEIQMLKTIIMRRKSLP